MKGSSIAIRFLIPLFLLVICAPAAAETLKVPVPLNIDTVEDFTVYQAAIRNQLNTSDEFAEISAENRHRAFTLMTEMSAIIDRSGSIEGLPPLPRVEVFNRQEELNQILARAAEDSRMICRRERPTGSKFPVNNCRTLAQRRVDQEEGRHIMRDVIPGRGVR